MSTTSARGVARFFATVRSCGVERTQDRWFAGVCGGVAERLGVDPLLVRGVLVALTVVGGLGLAAYGVCWLLLPDGRPASSGGDGPDERPEAPRTPGRIEAEAVLRGDVSGAAWLAGALVLADLVLPRALLGLLDQNLDGPGWGFLTTGLIALLGWWFLRDFRVPPLDPARRAALDAPTPEPTPEPAAPDAATQPLSLVKQPPPAPDGPAAGFGSPTERRAAARLAREQARVAAVEEKTRRRVEEVEERVREAQEKAARARAARRPGSPLLTTAALGVALLVVGCVVAASLLTASGPWSDLPLADALRGRTLTLAAAAAAVVLGLGAVLAGLRGRRTALVGLAWPAALVAVATVLVPPAGNWTGDVDRTWTPTGTSALSSAVGRLTVDPGALDEGTATATVAAGQLAVVVPTDRTVLLDVTVLAGSLRWQPGADLVEVGERARGGGAVAGGVHLRRVFAAGPGAADLAADVTVRGDDPADWTVPAGTPRVRAASWTGEVRVGPAGSTVLEAS